MKDFFTVDELIDTLINHWSFWDEHEKYYLQELAPKLVANPSFGDETEIEIFQMLRAQLGEDEWKALPNLISKRRSDVLLNKALFRPLRGTAQEWREQRVREIENQRSLAQAAEEARLEALRHKEEENEKIKQENQRLENDAKRNKFLAQLYKVFNDNFLGADSYFEATSDSCLSKADYEREKAMFVQGWMKDNADILLDVEQAAAVASVHGHTLVTARAGSGKTRTLVSRAIFLQKHCRVSPTEIILLVFNKKASEEIKTRLGKVFNDRVAHTMTFHALAYALVHPEQSLIHDEPSSENQGMSREIQKAIDDHLQIPAHKAQIRELMLAHFREAWDRIVEGRFDAGREDLLQYRRSLQPWSMKGDYVKSYGEKVIADFLFEHDIPYWYERNYEWGNINYKPDFTILKTKQSGVIIEYFGLKGDQDYDEMSEAKRNYWRAKKEWVFLEYEPKDVTSGGIKKFQKQLEESLKKHGIPCSRLSEDEIWNRVRDRAIDRFTKVCRDFIGRCRKLGHAPNELDRLISGYEVQSNTEGMFLKIASMIYKSYLERLAATDKEDFDGLMQRAAETVSNGTSVFERKSERGDIKKICYVLIDEFQDFSELFYKLILAMRKQNPQIEVFCVGDDWQAINGFAGSDLKFFKKFEEYFNQAHLLNISTNYRSPQVIVDIGNRLMDGLGKPAISGNSISGQVLLADLSEFKRSLPEKERHPYDKITPAVLRLTGKALSDGLSITLLCRRNGLPWFVSDHAKKTTSGHGLDSYLDLIRGYFPKEHRDRITISTAHKYKGLEKQVVIILDAVVRSYPLVHPDSVFLRILGDSPEKILDEERRLFYVALTRAQKKMVIITEKGTESPFLDEIMTRNNLLRINWSDFPTVTGQTSRVVVKVGNQQSKGIAPTLGIKEALKASGYEWQATDWKGWVKSFPTKNFDIEVLKREIWASTANGIEVQILNEQESLIARYYVDAPTWKRIDSVNRI